MKNEKLKLSKLESIQMNNFLMKKELISYLEVKYQNQIYGNKFNIFITSFIEDLFNILSQQILICCQIHELNADSEIEHLINNNKNISFSMIINFYEKVISFINSNKNKNKISLTRNFSDNIINNKKIKNLTDKDNYNRNISEFEKDYFKKKYKTNYNSLQRSLIKNNTNNYKNNQSNILLTLSPNNSKNANMNNIKFDYLDLDRLSKNKEKEEIQIFVKPNTTRKYNNIKNVNNKIILTKNVYKVCNSIPVIRKNFLNNDFKRKNSFNKKIKNNKMNIKKSKNSLKSVNVSNHEDQKK